MQRFGGVVRDTAGNSVSNATVSVFLAGTATPATLYSDNVFTLKTNPFTANVDGSWSFYVKPGRYDIQYAKTGFSFGTEPTFDQLNYDYMSVITPAQITANQNNYAPTNGANVEQWRISSDAVRAITGISATTVVTGQTLTIFNVGGFSIILNEEDAASTAANRIITGVGNLTLQANQSAVLKYDTTSSRWRVLASPITIASANSLFAETFTGCALSNSGGDPVNDIDTAAGAVSSDDATISSRDLMTLTASITKQLDVNWAVGTNQGGLDTGAIANGTYHVFVIKRVDTGVTDVLFSTSPTAPTMPANYTKKRRVGSILREGGSIVPFVQDGDIFRRKTSVLDVNVSNPGDSAVTRLLSVPTGINVFAFGNIVLEVPAGGSSLFIAYLSDLAATDEAPSSGAVAPLATLAILPVPGSANTSAGQWECRTNTSAQIRSRVAGSAASYVLRLATLGWLDRRGRG